MKNTILYFTVIAYEQETEGGNLLKSIECTVFAKNMEEAIAKAKKIITNKPHFVIRRVGEVKDS